MNDEEEAIVREVVKMACSRYRIPVFEEEDIAQDVIFRLLTKKRRSQNLRGWVYLCALNIIRHGHRSAKIHFRHAPNFYHYRAALAEKKADRRDDVADAVRAMLRILTPRQRLALIKWFRRKEGLTAGKIPGRERALVHRAFVAIREIFPEAASLIG